MLFLVAGNILTAYQSKSTVEVRGVLRVLLISGLLWIVGLLAITGSPPFGTFLSEFTILKAALDQGQNGVAIAYLVFLAIIFVGMATAVLEMAQGTPSEGKRRATEPESLWTVLSSTVLGVLVLILGLYLPPVLRQTVLEAAHTLE